MTGIAAPPTALTIAGSDSGGGAGIQADLKTFLSCHVHGMSAITAVTVQNSLGVSGFYELPPHAVAEQIAAVAGDIGVGAAKTGMLASAAIIEAVADTLEELAIGPLVVDPVAASQHGDALLRPDALEALRSRILPLATVVTPNRGEVRLLTGIDVVDDSAAREAAHALFEMGPRWVVVKGGHRDGESSTDLIFDGSQFTELTVARRATQHTHGTGDTFAAATCAALARGLDVATALRAGKAYVTNSIDGSFPLGAGLGPVGHFWRIRNMQDGYLT